MAQIGQFTRTTSGYSGRLHTLTVAVDIALVAIEPSDAENAPAYRIHLGEDGEGPEIGAGWKHTGERAGEYVSLLIDDPAFTQPIRANLFQNGDDKSSWSLQWNRPPRRGEQA